ncbi:hypothetical protein [Pararcticibacter amylolyticus]|uniref:DUF4890 domain-containing protein n=1 Tax=Pararcticibacter amylolyticus TaxID=2173175 RepID=A0A2U2PA20_9SPHI|nr:hypothetical protein [Pararcticibacter amylolyticus]PWG77979.1 hypothetical protein DDR33_24655 [Pararcticibacter amylolyticus]
MKTLIIFLAFLAGYLLTSPALHAQTRPDSIRARQRVQSTTEQKRTQLNYYKRTLKVDSVKAEQVTKIQSDYKDSMKALEADKSLNDDARRSHIKALIAERNRKLADILDPQQQARIIPSTERQQAAEEKKD